MGRRISKPYTVRNSGNVQSTRLEHNNCCQSLSHVTYLLSVWAEHDYVIDDKQMTNGSRKMVSVSLVI